MAESIYRTHCLTSASLLILLVYIMISHQIIKADQLIVSAESIIVQALPDGKSLPLAITARLVHKSFLKYQRHHPG